jgi:prepilin-type N-terminal cleavage/methylation domain-containing protein
MKMKMGLRKNGFTLVELSVVVVIVGILSTLAISRYRTLTVKAKIQEAVLYVKYLQQLEDAYYASYGVLPHQDGTLLWVVDKGLNDNWLGRIPWWRSFMNRTSTRLRQLGVDPPTGGKARFWYYFAWWGGGSATRIIYAYPKTIYDIWSFPQEECDRSLENVTIAIDNDGSVYVWGVPGMEWMH